MNTFVGILHTSSAISYTTNKTDTIKKEFTPFVATQHKILVKTKKMVQTPDLYIIAKFESFDLKTNVITCIVAEYLDEVGEFVNINKLLKALSTCHWTRKHDKLFLENVLLDLTPDRTTINSDIEIYSIDPEGCLDIDDALHCIKSENGYQIGVHIADVSSYILEGSVQDIELSKRVETFYSEYDSFPNQNMIPNIISLENASLLDSKTSRAFSVIVDFDNQFNIIKTEFKKTLINVMRNISYDDAKKMINLNESKQLCDLYEFGKQLFKKSLDEYDTHEMVAVYMILANKLVAEHISKIYPNDVILRVQNSIVAKSIENKKFYNKYLNCLNERAIYVVGKDDDINKTSHVSLGLSYYTHFTSPIRRYVDILTHRLLYNSLQTDKINTKMQNTKTREIVTGINEYSKYYKKLQRHTKLLNVVKCIDTISEFDSTIISLNSENNTIRVYVEIIDLEIDIKIFNNKLQQIIENISDDENELVIINTQTENKVTLSLFQKIKIQIVKTQNIFKPIVNTIINPNIQELLFLNNNDF